MKQRLPKRQYVKHCLFVPSHNFFVISINEKAQKQSRLEIHIFQKTGIVKDQYVLKQSATPKIARTSGSFPQRERTTSVLDLHQSPSFTKERYLTFED